jgi:hypothetical protein
MAIGIRCPKDRFRVGRKAQAKGRWTIEEFAAGLAAGQASAVGA